MRCNRWVAFTVDEDSNGKKTLVILARCRSSKQADALWAENGGGLYGTTGWIGRIPRRDERLSRQKRRSMTDDQAWAQEQLRRRSA